MNRMRASIPLPPAVLGALALAALLPAPALAGIVFVPLASQLSIGGASYTTKVWVSNPDQTTHHFVTMFIPQGVDGTSLQSPSGSINVAPSATTVLDGVAPAGQSGLLEVSGGPQLVVGASLEVTDANGNLLGAAAIPAISQANALAAGGFVELQGLQRNTGGMLTDFSLVNLDGAAAQCTVAAFATTGPALAAPTTLSMSPLSRRDFADVLAILGSETIADARIVATCDHTFFAFATVYQPGGAGFQFVGPSPALTGTLGPGIPTGSGGGPGTAPGTVTFTAPGIFLNATNADSEADFNMPVPTGVPFKRATFDWDMRIGTFPTGLFTGVMAFRRPNSSRALREPFCAVQIVNRNSKTLLDLGLETAFVRTTGPWKQNSAYHLELTYDLTVNQCSLAVSVGGSVIYTIAGPAQWFDMSANNNPLQVAFGQTGIGDGAYYPPIGWSFSNLSVVLVPK
ncbi:MAG TPA: hypothetical protein VKY89_24095 [Thermoanaerobaculia bacterium]|nr:hypothetical protein [Thermoanaerobaculia bacterium]